MSQGLFAGTPQVIMPMSFDQFDNAQRVRRLGVGAELAPARFTGRRLAAALNGLLDSDQVRDRAHHIARRFAGGQSALLRTADEIEKMSPSPVAGRA